MTHFLTRLRTGFQVMWQMFRSARAKRSESDGRMTGLRATIDQYFTGFGRSSAQVSEYVSTLPKVKTVRDAIKLCKKSFITVAFFSAIINALMLVPPLYMLQVYDRVIASGSIPTLWMLSIIMVFLLVIMGVLEWVRSQMLVRISARFDGLLSDRLFRISMQQALYSGGRNTQAQPLQDLLGLRQFLTGNGLFAFFDAPWLPIYIIVMFLLHPIFGWFGVGATVVLALLALANERMTSPLLAEANKEQSALSAKTSKNLRNAEVVHAMGMYGGLRDIWHQGHQKMLGDQSVASHRAGFFVAFSKTIRIVIQSVILGVGAYLAVQQQITPGLMIAGSILLGRALAPVDQMIGVWRQFVTARGQFARLDELLQKVPLEVDSMALPDPVGVLSFENVVVTPPGRQTPMTSIGTMQFPPGVIGVIGPSAAGKSTFVRGLLGIWPLAKGVVRLDGADIHRWDREHLGRFLGYLPQDIELFEGSVAENIARFGAVESELVVQAAMLAGVHEMILQLPQGYDTDIGSFPLSAGQRQRVALARAVYNLPRLIVLDEPNSNLDEVGEVSLSAAVTQLKAAGSTVVVVSHRKSILQVVDQLLVMADGQIKMFGPRDQVLQKLSGANSAGANVATIPVAPAKRS
jgi:ATP-binding cassette, subfamily C, bacterial EexD